MSGYTGGVGYTPINNNQSGGNPLLTVSVATTGNIDLTSGLAVYDGYTMQSGNPILVWAQTPDTGNGNPDNGAYLWNGIGVPLTRLTGFTTWQSFVGLFVGVVNGTTWGETTFISGALPGGTLGTTNLQFIDSSSGNVTASGGITKTGNNVTLTTNSGASNSFASSVNGSGNLVFTQPSISNISGLSSALDLKANLASPAFTGIPTAPTPSYPTNTTQIVTGAYVADAISAIPSAPVTSVFTRVGAVTAQSGDYDISQITGLSSALALLAPLDSPTFTDNPSAPTQSPTDNSTRLATTAFVATAIADLDPNGSPYGVTYVASNGNDTTGVLNSIFFPFLTEQAAVNVIPSDGSVIQIYPNPTTINNVELILGQNNITIQGIQGGSMNTGTIVNDFTITDQTMTFASFGVILADIYVQANLEIDNYNDFSGSNNFNNLQIGSIVYTNQSGAVNGVLNGSTYTNCTIQNSITYFDVGFALQNNTIQESYINCNFNNYPLTLNGETTTLTFYNCINLPVITYANGATAFQIAYINTPVSYPINYQATNTTYTLQPSDVGKIITFAPTVPTTIILPEFTDVSLPTGYNVTIINQGTENITFVLEGAGSFYGSSVVVPNSGAFVFLTSSDLSIWNAVANTAIAVASLNSSANNMNVELSGVTSANVPIINSNVLGSSVNTMTSTINGVGNTGTGTIINSISFSQTGTLNSVLNCTVNGISTSTSALVQPLVASAVNGNLISMTAAGINQNSGVSVATVVGTDNTTVTTSEAVVNYVMAQVTAARSYRGNYDASTNLFPTIGGSGTAGAIVIGDEFLITVAGTLGTQAVIPGNFIIASVSTPGQTQSNWGFLLNLVTSVFSRVGAVTAQTGDYTIAQITNGLSNVGTSAYVMVGNGSNIMTPTAMIGDVYISNAGNTTIQNGVVGNGKLAVAPSFTYKANNSNASASVTDVVMGSLTERTSSVLSITGASNSLLNAATIQVIQSTTSSSGYLSSTDWNTFNGKTTLANVLATNNTFTKAQVVGTAILTSSSNLIATNAANSNVFTHTLTQNTTLSNPTGLIDGGWYQWQFTQAATAFTLAFGTVFTWAYGAPLVVGVTSGEVDIMTCWYDGVAGKLRCNTQYNFS